MILDVDFRDIAIGDVLPAADDDAALFGRGRPHWYALTVRPQCESRAEGWLRRRGVYAFHPVLNLQRARYGRVIVHYQRYLPGYVFARVPGKPVVHRFLSGPFVTGALCRSDGDREWGVLAPSELRAIHAMRQVDVAADEQRRLEIDRKRRAATIRSGDRALFQSGVFAGSSCEVVEIRAIGRVMVRLSLFGRETTVEAGTDEMVRLAS